MNTKRKPEMITWIASYPKSGNTWVRFLIQAYYQNGHLDINESMYTSADHQGQYTTMVSPIPVEALQMPGKLLLRPAALLNQIASIQMNPKFIKTHHMNGRVADLPQLIPQQLTARAIYIMRDPRDVAVSFAQHMNKTQDEIVIAMNTPGYALNPETNIPHCLNTWSQHVKSWTQKLPYPVLCLTYEQLAEHTREIFISILEFCEIEPDMARVDAAIEACALVQLRKQEETKGFQEKRPDAGDYMFFGHGGSRWVAELAPRLSKQIEQDHGEMMKEWGYI